MQVNTIDGPVDLKVPAGVQPGTTLLMAKKGVPRLGNATLRGDQLVTVSVSIPQVLRLLLPVMTSVLLVLLVLLVGVGAKLPPSLLLLTFVSRAAGVKSAAVVGGEEAGRAAVGAAVQQARREGRQKGWLVAVSCEAAGERGDGRGQRRAVERGGARRHPVP